MKYLISLFILIGLISTASGGVFDTFLYVVSSYQRCVQDTKEEIINSHAYYDYDYEETIEEAEDAAYVICDTHPIYREKYGLD